MRPTSWVPTECASATVMFDVVRAMGQPGDTLDWVRDRPGNDRLGNDRRYASQYQQSSKLVPRVA